MDAVEMDLVAREVDALAAEIEEARYRHVAGLETEPELARLFPPRSRAAHRDTVAALRERGDEDLAARVAALRAERAQATAEEAWRAADAAAVARALDRPVPLSSALAAVPREEDRERRAARARAALEAGAAAAARREEAAEVRARARAEGGLFPDWKVVVEGDQALNASEDAYRDVLAFRARRDLGLAPRPEGDLARADLLRIAALPRWDGLFRPGMLPVALKLAFERLGLDLARIRIDGDDRARKWPGVHVHGPRVSFRPSGGAGDWQDLLEGAGAALAFAHAPASRRDPVFPWAMGALLGGLVLEPRFLAERADVERRHAPDVIRDLALRRLFRLRARAAALRVATEVERGLSGARWRDAYRDALSTAALASWDGALASRDAEAADLAARLRGEGTAARLRVSLTERFDDDWWRNPRTAEHLAALLAAGRHEPGAPAAGAKSPVAPGPAEAAGENAAPEAALPSPEEAARELVARLG